MGNGGKIEEEKKAAGGREGPKTVINCISLKSMANTLGALYKVIFIFKFKHS